MGVKANLYLGIEGQGLVQRVSRAAKSVIPTAELTGQTIDAVVFPFTASDVVTSRALKRALEGVDESSQAKLVIVGWDFTLEARALVEERAGILVFAREFGWSDERWAAVRQN